MKYVYPQSIQSKHQNETESRKMFGTKVKFDRNLEILERTGDYKSECDLKSLELVSYDVYFVRNLPSMERMKKIITVIVTRRTLYHSSHP